MNENSFHSRSVAPVQETFEALRARVRDRHDRLSPHLQRIARAALEQPNDFALKTVVSIASEVGVQPSTLIRFAKEFGYSGFSEMQRIFRHRLIEGAAGRREEIYVKRAGRRQADHGRVLEDCINAQAASLDNLRRSATPDKLARAMAMLEDAGHVHIAGLRRSRAIAAYLAYGLTRSERPCSLLDFGGGMTAEQVANIRSNDVLVAIAFTPYSQQVVDVVVDASLSGKRVLALTDVEDSPLVRHSELAFLVDHAVNSQFRPISGAIALVQTIITILGEQR